MLKFRIVFQLCLEELNLGKTPPKIACMMISLAMERKASQREMTSVLLSDMYGHILQLDDIAAGFDMLLENLPDLILDTPDAATVSVEMFMVCKTN